MYKILVVDDDFEILKLMRTILEMKNYQVMTYQEVTVPIDINNFKGFDLILLDVMMPNIDGMQICKQIRNKVSSPIIFVSAKDTEEDIVSGLNLGGDDYITKPFSINQLIAKVAANLKREERYKQGELSNQIVRELSPITIYLQEKIVCINGDSLAFTSREYDIIELLSSNPRKIFTVQDIYENVYDDDAATLFRAICAFFFQLRLKLSAYGFIPIKTVRGMGYKWHD